MVYEMDEDQEIKILEKRLVVLKAEIQELQAIRKEQAEDIQELETENKQLRDALQWYALTVKHCKKDGNGGDIARHMLVEDAGKRADNALKEAGDEES